MLSTNEIRCRRQRTVTSTFLPGPTNSKQIQIIQPIHIQTNLYHEPEYSLFRDTTASLNEALLFLMESIQEYNCLGRALCIYVFSIKMNIIENTQTLFTFLRYYPTIVGWLLLASKLQGSYVGQKSNIGYKQGSTHTFATISSHMSYDNDYAFDLDGSEHSLDLRQICTASQSWGQFADIDTSSSTLGEGVHNIDDDDIDDKSIDDNDTDVGNKSACTSIHNMFSSSQPTKVKADLVHEDDHIAGSQVNATNSDNNIMTQSEQRNRNEGNNDWGHFADFADAEPRPMPLNVMENRALLQQKAITLYATCMRALQIQSK